MRVLACSVGLFLWSASPARAQLTPELRLHVGETPEAPITVVSDLELDRNGRIYVAEPIEAAVYVLDTSGTILNRIGRQGGGPGEFRRPLGLGWKADTLWVADPSQRRISLFQRDGDFVRSAGVQGLNMVAALLNDGSVLAVASQQQEGLRYLLRIPPGGTHADTLVHLDVPGRTRIAVGPGAIVTPQPFAHTDLWSASSDGGAVYVVRSGNSSDGEHRIQIMRFAPMGNVVYTRRHRYEPKPLTDAIFERVVSDLIASIEESRPPGMGPAPLDEQAIRDALSRTRFLPPVTDLLPNRDGSLWIRREEREGASARWDIIDPHGDVAGSITLPRDLSVLLLDGKQLWGVERDEWDLPIIVRYRVP